MAGSPQGALWGACQVRAVGSFSGGEITVGFAACGALFAQMSRKMTGEMSWPTPCYQALCPCGRKVALLHNVSTCRKDSIKGEAKWTCSPQDLVPDHVLVI